MNIPEKIEMLAKAPAMLEEMLAEIPSEILKIRRIEGKWSIHEHACHLAEAQKMMIERFKIFKSVSNPVFKPYLPGTDSTPDDYLMEMDLAKSLEELREDRQVLIQLLESFEDKDWINEGEHPEYKQYNAAIFLRHILMHDHLHMYRIEQLWLTTDNYL